MNSLIKRLNHWWNTKWDKICPVCNSDLLETYSGTFGGRVCSNKKCKYNFKYNDLF